MDLRIWRFEEIKPFFFFFFFFCLLLGTCDGCRYYLLNLSRLVFIPFIPSSSSHYSSWLHKHTWLFHNQLDQSFTTNTFKASASATATFPSLASNKILYTPIQETPHNTTYKTKATWVRPQSKSNPPAPQAQHRILTLCAARVASDRWAWRKTRRHRVWSDSAWIPTTAVDAPPWSAIPVKQWNSAIKIWVRGGWLWTKKPTGTHWFLLVITFICLESRRLVWVHLCGHRFFTFLFRSGIDLSAFHVPHYNYDCGRVHMKTGDTVGVWNYSTRHGQFGHDMKFVVDGIEDSMGIFFFGIFFLLFFNSIYPFVQSLSLHTGHVPSAGQCLIISDRF